MEVINGSFESLTLIFFSTLSTTKESGIRARISLACLPLVILIASPLSAIKVTEKFFLKASILVLITQYSSGTNLAISSS